MTCDAETGHRKQRSQLAFRTAELLDDKHLLSHSDRMFTENRSIFFSQRQMETYGKTERISVAVGFNKTPQRLQHSPFCYSH
jgi:hypothetical protein